MSSASPPGPGADEMGVVVDPAAPSAFERLPEEIIQQILQQTDPDSFASLVLLNSKWRRVSQQAHLYAHHLLRCTSYSASHSAATLAALTDHALPTLRRLFSREVKRNLFEAYLRPTTTTIKLVSNSISSSSAPGGEGMQFSPSPRGHHLLAYNSSRIYVLDVRGLEVNVKRELKILRRPVSACILDDGTLLAVLSSDMQVDLYNLEEHPPRRTQSLILDHTPRTIALSPCGKVLAAAYEGGIEVSSLSTGALPTDRRAVKCDGVDSLAFSSDGTQLLGTTTVAYQPNTVILTAPYYDPGAHMGEDNISALWTTSILFPNTSRDCSHAVLIQENSSQEACWTFTYDRSFETFRAVRIDDLRNGTTYFTGPIPHSTSQTTLLPCTLPTATCNGELVSAGFEGKDVWLYGIPEDLEAIAEFSTASDASTPGLNRRGSAPSIRSPSRMQESTGATRVPQWQILCDRNRNTFVGGRKVAELTGVRTVKWVTGHGEWSCQERLIVAAKGVQPPKPITEEDGIDFADGGRITILDFDYSIEDGQETEITVEVGTKEPETLEEEYRDMATEVAIVRRRTVAQRNGGLPGVMRASTLASRQADSLLRPPLPNTIPRNDDDDDDDDDPLIPRRMTGPRPAARRASIEDDPEEPSLEDVQEALDAPYAHASPRSAPTLRRAATAAAVNRRLHPALANGGRIEYRRADGRGEHPHESDADNWVPPPPPYTKDDPGDVPAFLRHASIPGVGLNPPGDVNTSLLQHRASLSVPLAPPQLPRQVSPTESSSESAAIAESPPFQQPESANTRPELPRIRTSPIRERRPLARASWQPQALDQRMTSDMIYSRDFTRESNTPRPASSPVCRPVSQFPNRLPRDDDDDIYDVSPVEPPTQAAESPQQPQGLDMSAVWHVHSNPLAPSSGTLSLGNEFTLSSSTAQSVATGSSGVSAAPYSLNVTIPSPGIRNAMWNEARTEASPQVGRFPNTGTWPRAVQTGPTAVASSSGYPYSAPVVDETNADMVAASLPPAPRPDQLAKLNTRRNSGPPRPASGSFQISRVPVGRSSEERSTRVPVRNSQIMEAQRPPSEPEQPLIISTPKGVTGAFDAPGQTTSQGHGLNEPVLHAPVPRHPHPQSGSNTLRPTVERLETIYSITSSGGRSANEPSQYYNAQGHSSVPPPPPPTQINSSSLRHHASLHRRQSRARRSAAKNLKDAKNRGWTGRRKTTKQNTDAMSGTWTDITWPSNAPKDMLAKGKKCAVM